MTTPIRVLSVLLLAGVLALSSCSDDSPSPPADTRRDSQARSDAEKPAPPDGADPPAVIAQKPDGPTADPSNTDPSGEPEDPSGEPEDPSGEPDEPAATAPADPDDTGVDDGTGSYGSDADARPSPADPPAEAMSPEQFAAKMRQLDVLMEDADFRAAQVMVQRLLGELPADDPRQGKLRLRYADIRQARRAEARMPFAIRQLGSDRPEAVRLARRQIRDADWVGLIFLRQAVREQPPAVVAEAAGMLVQAKDPSAATAMVQRLLAEGPAADVAPPLAEALQALAPHAQPEAARLAHRTVAGTKIADRPHLTAFLGAYHRHACQADSDAFDQAVGQPGAFAKLHKNVQKAMAGDDGDVRDWLARNAGNFGLHLQGLRGQFYAGKDLKDLVVEKLVPEPVGDLDKLPYPKGRKENLSVRWTGLIRVDKAGSYAFHSASDDGQRVWIDGEQIVNDWRDHGVETETGKVELEPGLHEIRIEWYQGSGGGSYKLTWTPPGADTPTAIPTDRFFTMPWPEMELPDPSNP